MRTRRIVLCLVMLSAAVFAAGTAGVPDASASDLPVLKFAPGVVEKLAAFGREFTLDWGVYKHT